MRKQLFFISVFVMLTITLEAQPAVEAIKTSWNNKSYSKAIELTNAYYKKNTPMLKLDLIKISSMCMLGVSAPNPSLCFDYVINAYKLPDNVQAIIQRAKTNCKSLDLQLISNYVSTASYDPPRTVGKTGRTTDQQKMARMGDTTVVIKAFNAEELQLRRLPFTSKKKPVAYFQHLYDSLGLKNVQVKAAGKFVFCFYNLQLNGYGLVDVETKLKAYYDFFLRQYHMKEPKDYITIFLANDINELQDFSAKLHGFRPPSYTLGYSNLEDQCIVAIGFVPQKPLLGTTCHELFHILSKSSYETLPAWLEEGMASLYEVSQLQGDSVVGMNNWRIQFLLQGEKQLNRKAMDFKLKNLVLLDWNRFNKPDWEGEPVQSFNYAYSRYVMLYLQEKGTLASFFKAAAAYTYMDIKEGPVEDYVNMIAAYSGDGKDVDDNFKEWLKKQPMDTH